MKPGKNLPSDRKKRWQAGQSLVEFALLLLVIASMSFIFIRVTNQGLGRYWTAYARLIVDDPAQNGSLNLQ